MKVSVFLLGVVLTLASAYETSYNGYKVYEVHPSKEEHVEIIKQLEDQDELDFWSDLRHIDDSVHIMVPPSKQEEFAAVLNNYQIQFSTMIDDVQSLVDLESEQQARAKARNQNFPRRIQWDQYYGVDEINEYLAYLAATYPDIVTLEDAGLSLEGRGMIFAKISSDPAAEKPIILIDGGIHAREWISPATVTYIIYQLVENATNRHWLDELDWYILPVLNPDGYEFSRTNTRLWRKTRAPGTSTSCFGVDMNRNFDYHWGVTGVSTNECSDIYLGPIPNSEIETQNFIAFAKKYLPRIKLYLNYHSWGNYFLYPWGYIYSAAPNGDELHSLGDAAAAAIEAYSGRQYTVGVASTTLYATAGDATDYAYGVLNITLTYCVELPGEGVGFLWPPERIFPVAQETWDSVEVLGEYIARLYGKK